MSEVAIVTGGTGSIGAAICAELQARGAMVVVADSDLRAVPDGQTLVQCDVTSPASLRQMFDRASALGKVKSLVAAHGILADTPAGGADLDTVSRVIDVDLKGVAYLCDLAGSTLAEGGAIVLMSSISAFMGRVQNGYAYQASKAGVEALTQVFAVAYGPRRIRVNCIAPGFMTAPMKGPGAKMRERQGGNETVVKTIPLGRLIAPEEVAKATAFLCSKDAAAITGVVLPIDGGQRAF
ncbi:MAG: SDR family oxidoreductase [Alphaproteobacteria bacterium]